jgi:uncharacterized membrane protein
MANPEKIALFLGLSFGLAVALLTPPFQGMDEANHFARVYQLAMGEMLSESHAGELGGFLPASISKSVAPYKRFYYNLDAKFDMAEFDRALGTPLKPRDKAFTEFANTAQYAVTVYLPHLPGVLLARTTGLSPVLTLYAGRISGAIVYALLVMLAVRITPIGKWTLLLVAFMPVPFFVGSVINADLTANALAFLFIAVGLRHVMGEERAPLTRREFAILCGLGVSLALAKLAYLPMLLIALMIPAQRVAPNGKVQLQRYAIFAFLCLGAFVVWAAVNMAQHTPMKPGVNASEQMSFLLHNPLHLVVAFVRTCVERSVNLLFLGVGALGYLETTIPFLHFIGYIWLLFFAAIVDGGSEKKMPARCRFWLLIAAVANLIFTTVLIYINSTAVGNPTIPDLSCRYMIPMLPAVLLVLHSPLFVAARPGLHRKVFAVCLLFSMISMITTIALRYY